MIVSLRHLGFSIFWCCMCRLLLKLPNYQYLWCRLKIINRLKSVGIHIEAIESIQSVGSHQTVFYNWLEKQTASLPLLRRIKTMVINRRRQVSIIYNTCIIPKISLPFHPRNKTARTRLINCNDNIPLR